MRQSVLLEANKIVIRDCTVLTKNFSAGVMENTVQIIKAKNLTPNELLIPSSEDLSKAGVIFFVESGEIDILQEFSLDHKAMADESNSSISNSSSTKTPPSKKRLKRIHTVKKG